MWTRRLFNFAKAIYGLVQAARQFWKKIVDKVQGGCFQLSEADPHMLYKEDEKVVCIIIIYIDDMLIIAKRKPLMLQLKYCKVIFK